MKLPEKLAGRSWHTIDGDVTSEHLERVLVAIQAGGHPCNGIAGADTTDRRVDRALKLLKSGGLITYDKATRRWVLLKRNYAA